MKNVGKNRHDKASHVPEENSAILSAALAQIALDPTDERQVGVRPVYRFKFIGGQPSTVDMFRQGKIDLRGDGAEKTVETD